VLVVLLPGVEANGIGRSTDVITESGRKTVGPVRPDRLEITCSQPADIEDQLPPSFRSAGPASRSTSSVRLMTLAGSFWVASACNRGRHQGRAKGAVVVRTPRGTKTGSPMPPPRSETRKLRRGSVKWYDTT
jgi:hypothetical protein